LMILIWDDTAKPARRHAEQAWLPYRGEMAGIVSPMCADGPHGGRWAGGTLPTRPGPPRAPVPVGDAQPSLAACIAPKTSARSVELREVRVNDIAPAPETPAGSHRLVITACAVSNNAAAPGMSVSFYLFRRDGTMICPVPQPADPVYCGVGQTYALGAGGKRPEGAPPVVVPIAAETTVSGIASLSDIRPEMIVEAASAGREWFAVPFVIPH
jgi:hypothetical protein